MTLCARQSCVSRQSGRSRKREEIGWRVVIVFFNICEVSEWAYEIQSFSSHPYRNGSIADNQIGLSTYLPTYIGKVQYEGGMK